MEGEKTGNLASKWDSPDRGQDSSAKMEASEAREVKRSCSPPPATSGKKENSSSEDSSDEDRPRPASPRRKSEERRRHTSPDRSRKHSHRSSSKDRHHGKDHHRRQHRHHSEEARRRHHGNSHRSSDVHHSSHRSSSHRSGDKHGHRRTSDGHSTEKRHHRDEKSGSRRSPEAKKSDPDMDSEEAVAKQAAAAALAAAALAKKCAPKPGPIPGFVCATSLPKAELKEAPSELPLSSDLELEANAACDRGKATPQQAMLHAMVEMQEQVKQQTGVELPKYYNPAAVNASKFATQIQKRKLLWSGKRDEPKTEEQWKNTTFRADEEGKVQSKFQRLMGIKGEGSGQPAAAAPSGKALEDQERRQKMLSNIESEYEKARVFTHMQRGSGFGFSTATMSAPPNTHPAWTLDDPKMDKK